ncbi:MAG: ABC transporter ATP-binding protein [Nitrospirae bacterium]|nr:ABC transporter ATP-binding protein [Nitrospirota bacterium]
MLSAKVILELRDCSFSYMGDDFIEGLNLQIKEGEFIALLGANGSGKSTLLKLLSGILRPHEGKAILWGKPIWSLKDKDRAKLISYLPQVLDISVPFKVRELVEMGLYPYKSNPPMSLNSSLSMVNLMDKKDSLLKNLSGGERRRAFIAMTLLQGAGILLLDEPLQNLDIKYQLELIRLLKELNSERNITVVMALHDINLALRFDKVMLIKEGRLLGMGTPNEVLTEALLKEAFDISLTVKKNGKDAFISYKEE